MRRLVLNARLLAAEPGVTLQRLTDIVPCASTALSGSVGLDVALLLQDIWFSFPEAAMQLWNPQERAEDSR
jgi:hypothetical protein